MADVNPKNDAEQAIYDAMVVLLNGLSTGRTVPRDHLRAVCHAAPEYAIRIITQNRTSLIQANTPNREERAELVRTIEWELLGPGDFIEYHNLNSDDKIFIYLQLQSNPTDFTRDNLYSLLKYFKRAGDPIRSLAIELLQNRVIAFADRLLAEPPQMSEDLASLKKSIRDYGFEPTLDEVLQKIDEELTQSADGFEQTATMKHIRSFFEKLIESIAKQFQVKKPSMADGTNLQQCRQAIDYLQRKGVVTEKIKELGRCLYGILSDDDYGVHALKATRDYTRLCRNMVVEYAVTLFLELDRCLAESEEN